MYIVKISKQNLEPKAKLLIYFDDLLFEEVTKCCNRVSNLVFTEAVVQRWSVEKVFLEISQNSQQTTCARASFLIKLQPLGLQLY